MTSALPLNDTTHQFSIDIPTGYVRRESKNALHSSKREDSDQASWAVLLIGTLGGTLDQNTEFDRELQLAGPTAAEAKLIAEFDGLVDSVKGETNWGMTLNQLEQLSQRVGYGVGCLGCGLVVAWLWFRKRSSKS